MTAASAMPGVLRRCRSGDPAVDFAGRNRDTSFELTVTNSLALERCVRNSNLLTREDRILVAVSGGPDSVALLHVLHGMREELRLHLEVAHVQHGLRGEEARQDAEFVAALADRLSVPFHLREIDLPRMRSAAGGGNLEALGRAERYEFFAEVAGVRGLSKVATAHTLDDQAETALMWFLRGTGLRGLGAMPPLAERLCGNRAVVVVRPFLDVTKGEVSEYLKERSLPFRMDSTNRDARLLRNWVRLDLLPNLQRRLDHRLPGRLARQASIFRDEDEVLEQLTRCRMDALESADGALDRIAFLGQPRALQRRILRMWIEQKKGHSRGLDFLHIEDCLHVIAAAAPHGRVAVPGGWELLREYDRLLLERQMRGRRAVCYDYPLTIGEILPIPEAGLEFWSGRVKAPCPLPQSALEAILDPARIAGPLSLRNFRAGDRVQPIGMGGHKKIKDLFMEHRVPLSLRSRWPLLVCAGEILWIPGYGRSAAAAVSHATSRAWRIVARPMQNRA